MRTAQAWTSAENLFAVSAFMTPASQELEPPANPGRFTLAHSHWRDILPDGYWFDVASALAAGQELSALRVFARKATASRARFHGT